MAGDNRLSTQELSDLIGELDDLYSYRSGSHSALNDAYANGRVDQRSDDADLLDHELGHALSDGRPPEVVQAIMAMRDLLRGGAAA